MTWLSRVLCHCLLADLPNGLSLPYFERGPEGGVPVVVLHGLGESHWSWSMIFPLLSPSVRAFAISQRGHGDATVPEQGYALSDFSNDLALFLDFVKEKDAAIVGHSLGV